MKPIKTLFVALCPVLLAASCLAAPVTYPGPQATDTAGTVVSSGITAAIVGVTDLDGNAIASPGAVAHIAGANPSVAYDAAAHGEAWVTYSLTASGHTFANVSLFCSSDPQTLAAVPGASANATAVWASGTRTLTAQADSPGVGTLLTRISGNLFPTTGDDYAELVRLETAAGSGVFKSAALVNAPTGGGGGSVTVAGYATGQDPATLLASSFAAVPPATLAAIKADASFIAALKRGQGRYSYNETTHAFQPEFNDGTPDGSPITLTVATDGTVTSR